MLRAIYSNRASIVSTNSNCYQCSVCFARAQLYRVPAIICYHLSVVLCGLLCCYTCSLAIYLFWYGSRYTSISFTLVLYLALSTCLDYLSSSIYIYPCCCMFLYVLMRIYVLFYVSLLRSKVFVFSVKYRSIDITVCSMYCA